LNIERAKAASFRSSVVVPNPKARLVDQVRDVLRLKHYSFWTEEACVQSIKRSIFFHGKPHLREMGAREIEMLVLRRSGVFVASPALTLDGSFCAVGRYKLRSLGKVAALNPEQSKII